ncbi:hypothetical protein LZ518_11305 [Sphingomonas sp. RB56-2]|uniref:Uncharacterized protein n=1 Tax=Sphingomonas brevis TaxID=2908206 RepID=A0ABT0SBJ5_9SPHN|nr:hypothetical protein [Sphingomonas brevis]MCL6741713.1 hypothetical protein [Sphingomonas brevis]
MFVKYAHVLALSAIASVALILAAAKADAQGRSYGPRNNIPSQGGGMDGGSINGLGGVWVVERDVPVVIEREVVKEVPVPVPMTPPEPRKPYLIGASYDSLPGGCMKLIEEGTSFYYCDGGWYQEVRAGRDPLYRAIQRKL